jgi:hypothetical protein
MGAIRGQLGVRFATATWVFCFTKFTGGDDAMGSNLFLQNFCRGDSESQVVFL